LNATTLAALVGKGPWLVGLVAAGLLTFAVFSLVEAGVRRL